jgi:DNA mismatch repair ATPase MutL
VEIEGGGIALLRVADDGFGMSETDARLRWSATHQQAAHVRDLSAVATLWLSRRGAARRSRR